MRLETGGMIYQQIAALIEDGILAGSYAEDAAVPSTNQFARVYQINPATAAKGLQLLTDEGLLYKKRGLGMYVSPGAREKLREARKRAFYETRLHALLEEAGRLGITREELAARVLKEP